MNYHDLFTYNPETGELTWKARPREHFTCDKGQKAFNTRYAGKVAGNKQERSNGDPQAVNVRLGVGTGIHRAHRVIWAMMTGEELPPSVLIDHKNGNPWDNRWSNLRKAAPHQNQYNSRIRRDNHSGIKGVAFVNRDQMWSACINVNGKRLSLGHHQTKGLAAVARAKAALRHHGQFARF